jgi:hypothetical protein
MSRIEIQFIHQQQQLESLFCSARPSFSGDGRGASGAKNGTLSASGGFPSCLCSTTLIVICVISINSSKTQQIRCCISYTNLVIPYSIHTKPRLLNVTMGNPMEKLLFPSIYLQPTFLIIRQSNPFITPITGTNSIRMASACWSWIEAYLPLDITCRAECEGGNVAGQVEGIGTGGGVEVFS